VGVLLQRLHVLQGRPGQEIPGLLLHLLRHDQAVVGMALAPVVHRHAGDGVPVPAGTSSERHPPGLVHLQAVPAIPPVLNIAGSFRGDGILFGGDLRGVGDVWRKEGGSALGASARHELPVVVVRNVLPVRVGVTLRRSRSLPGRQGG